jgi:hypothetical protein
MDGGPGNWSCNPWLGWLKHQPSCCERGCGGTIGAHLIGLRGAWPESRARPSKPPPSLRLIRTQRHRLRSTIWWRSFGGDTSLHAFRPSGICGTVLPMPTRRGALHGRLLVSLFSAASGILTDAPTACNLRHLLAAYRHFGAGVINRQSPVQSVGLFCRDLRGHAVVVGALQTPSQPIE